jgi:hypothetical protein
MLAYCTHDVHMLERAERRLQLQALHQQRNSSGSTVNMHIATMNGLDAASLKSQHGPAQHRMAALAHGATPASCSRAQANCLHQTALRLAATAYPACWVHSCLHSTQPYGMDH